MVLERCEERGITFRQAVGNASEGYTLVEVGGIDEDSTTNCMEARCANNRPTIRSKLCYWMMCLDDMTDRDARHAAIAKEEAALREEQIKEMETAPSILDEINDGSDTNNLSLMPGDSPYVPSYKLEKNEVKNEAQLEREKAHTEAEIAAEVKRQKATKKQMANAEGEQLKRDNVEQVRVGNICFINQYTTFVSVLISLFNISSRTISYLQRQALMFTSR